MHTKSLFPCFMVFYLLLAACKKEKPEGSNNPAPSPLPPLAPPTDTIFPGPYLPAYPGSWWIMHDEMTGDIDTVSTMSAYQVVNNFQYYAWIPVYNNNALYEYCSVPWAGTNTSFTTFPFLIDSLMLGDSWKNEYTQSGPPMTFITDSCKVVKMNDTLSGNSTVYSDVIGIEYTRYVNGMGPVRKRYAYYAKNIGMVKEVRYNEYYPASVQTGRWVLDSYFINH